MDILEMTAGGCLILAFNGLLDSTSAPVVRDRILGSLQGDAKRVLFDCENLRYVSSAGLRVLFEAAARAADLGIRLEAFGVREEVRRIFDMVDLPAELPLHPDRQTALS